jgi:hypothetical protein
MKKGDYLIQRGSNKIYVIAGRWDAEIVLADTDDDSEEILIYGAAELEKLISTGHFGKLYKTDLKVDRDH